MQRNNNFLKYTLSLVFILTIAFLYFQMKTTDKVRTDKNEFLLEIPTENQEIEEIIPRYPIPDISENEIDRKNLISLPPIGESDEYLRMELVNVMITDISQAIAKTTLVEKTVATIDNIPRSYMAERMRPIQIKPSSFVVEAQGNLNGFILSEENYERYDYLLNGLDSIDVNKLADIYLRFYPLLQEAYQDLGYPDAYFNDRLIDVIDHLLSTPEVNDPIILHRPNILFEYVHPELESLSSGQKLLIRTGKRHSSRIKQFIKEFRALIS